MGIYSFRKRIDDKYYLLQTGFQSEYSATNITNIIRKQTSVITRRRRQSEALLHKGVKHPVVPAGYGKQVLSKDKNTIIHYEK